MTTLSPLQILLLHIVKIIVDHIVGSSRLKYAVRKINFEFSMARADEVNELGEAVEARILSALETEANISCFVQRIKEMVPKVSNIEVQAKESLY
ncbi:hypothetical protein GGI20_002224 [Coemansia sp. BCRC 34301]|nr:hypothetical protein GGI20_002224 [Coemansia sp. BCRC 34301]